MMSCWALLAYIKAADTRQNSSFAVRLPKRKKKKKKSPPQPVPQEEPEDQEDTSSWSAQRSRSLFDSKGDASQPRQVQPEFQIDFSDELDDDYSDFDELDDEEEDDL
jgi:hypothetical protein